jgi:hypothetical protein
VLESHQTGSRTPGAPRSQRRLRYRARPPFARERLEQVDDDELICRLPQAQAGGSTQLRLAPLELIERLATLTASATAITEGCHRSACARAAFGRGSRGWSMTGSGRSEKFPAYLSDFQRPAVRGCNNQTTRKLPVVTARSRPRLCKNSKNGGPEKNPRLLEALGSTISTLGRVRRPPKFVEN